MPVYCDMVLVIAEQSNSHSQKDKNKYHEKEFAYMLLFFFEADYINNVDTLAL